MEAGKNNDTKLNWWLEKKKTNGFQDVKQVII